MFKPKLLKVWIAVVLVGCGTLISYTTSQVVVAESNKNTNEHANMQHTESTDSDKPAAEIISGKVEDEGTRGVFKSTCKFVKRLNADPIVFPDTEVAGHSHDFFGNLTTDGFSDYDSLIGQPTSCNITGDSAAYWVPTVYYDGVPVKAAGLQAYYRDSRRPQHRHEDPIVAFPVGLKIIAGTMYGSEENPQPLNHVAWSCSNDTLTEFQSIPYECDDTPLVMKVKFPSCSDGRTDSDDHKSHMAYPIKLGVCPEGFVNVPRLEFALRFKVFGEDLPTHVSLPEGLSDYGVHGDFFNAWDQAVLEERIESCIRLQQRCI